MTTMMMMVVVSLVTQISAVKLAWNKNIHEKGKKEKREERGEREREWGGGGRVPMSLRSEVNSNLPRLLTCISHFNWKTADACAIPGTMKKQQKQRWPIDLWTDNPTETKIFLWPHYIYYKPAHLLPTQRQRLLRCRLAISNVSFSVEYFANENY